ncbi:MAG: glycosyltransferase family 39 protein [Dehalococcoidia bacterium]
MATFGCCWPPTGRCGHTSPGAASGCLAKCICSALLAACLDLLVVPRIFSVALGLAAIGLVGAIGASLAGRRAGLFAAALLAADPGHLWVSATPLAENLHLALILVALLGVVRLLRDERTGWLALTGIALTLASTVRFEAWLFSGLFGLFVVLWLVHRRPPGAVAALALMTAGAPWLFPIAFIAGNALLLGDPLFWPNAFRAYNLRAYGPGADPAGVWEALWMIQGPLLAATVAGGFWAAVRRDRVTRIYLVAVAAPTLAVLVVLAAGREPLNNLVRYLVPFVALFAPLTGGMASAFFDRLGRRSALLGAAAAGLAALLLGVRLTADAPVEPSNSGLAAGRRIAALRASGQLPPGPLVVDSSNLAVYAMMVGANDVRTIRLDRPADRRVAAPPVLTLEATDLRACLAQVDAVGVVARTPGVEALPGARLLEVVDGFRIVQLAGEPGECPGRMVAWTEFARDTTGPLFAALAYRN